MKKRNRQLGSAHVVIIGLLIVALCTALGIVFYQNFIVKKTDTNQTKQTVVTAPTSVTTRVALNSTIYDLDHPPDWVVSSKQAGSARINGSTTTLQSAAGTVQIAFTVSDAPIAGSCDQTSSLKISSYSITNQVNTKLTGQPLALVESLFDHTGGGYDYTIGLTQDGGATHAAVGDAFCNVANVGMASTVQYAADGTTLTQPAIIAKVEFPKLTNTKGASSKDMQTIKDLMNSSDYTAAIKILESARKE